MVSKLHISIRVAIAMMISFILAIGNVNTASAVGTTTNTIAFRFLLSSNSYGVDFQLRELTSRGGGGVPTVTVNSPEVCSFNATTKKVTPLAAGTCSMTASDAGNDTYAAATPVTRTTTITKLRVSVFAKPSKQTWWAGESPATYTWGALGLDSSGSPIDSLPNGDSIVSATPSFSNYATQNSPSATLPSGTGLYDVFGSNAVFSNPGAADRYDIIYKKIPICVKDSALKNSTGGLVVCLDTDEWSVVEKNVLQYGWNGTETFTYPAMGAPGYNDVFLESANNTDFYRSSHAGPRPIISLSDPDPVAYAVGVASGYITLPGGPTTRNSVYCHDDRDTNVPIETGISFKNYQASFGGSTISGFIGSGGSRSAGRTLGDFPGGVYEVSSFFIKRGPASKIQPWTVKCRINGQPITADMFKTYAGVNPTVTSVSPSIGVNAGNTLITITGTGFVSGAQPSIGGMPCARDSVVFVSSTQIKCKTRSNITNLVGPMVVSVMNPNATSGALNDAFEYGTPKEAKTINYHAITDKPLSLGTLTTAPTVTGAGQTVSLASETPEVCTVSGYVITFVMGGLCTTTASSASNATFSAATPVTRSFTIEATPDAPTITAATVSGVVGGGAGVTFIAGNSNGANVTGFKVTATPADGAFGFPATALCPTAGVICTVTGLTPGVPYTFVASTLASLTSGPVAVPSEPFGPVTPKLPQVIELPNPGGKKPVAGTTFTVFPTSDIGSMVTPIVTSLTANICTVENNVVTLTGVAGDCTLSADQSGATARGVTYGAAEPAVVTFKVNSSVPTINSAFVSTNVMAGLPIAPTLANAAIKGTASIPTKAAWSATGLPAGLTIDPNTGVIKGTPTAPGVYGSIQVFLTDSAKITVSKTLSLAVAAAPGIVGPSTVAVVSGKPAVVDDLVALPGTASIPSTGAWAVTAGTLPAGLTLNPDTGVVSGTPSGVVGKVTVTITLTDSAPLTATKVLTFDVASAPVFGAAGGANPAATINLVGVAKVPGMKLASGAALVVPAVVPGTAGKPKKGAYTAVPTGSSTALPDGIVFNADTGAITGTPLVPGTYDFKVVFTDAKGLTAEQPYRFVVATPPTITNAVMLPVYTVPSTGTAPVYTVDLEGEQGTNSIPGTAAWSVVAPTALPAGLTLNADTGVITGTPPTGLTKDYIFKIKLVDSSGLVAEKTFTLPVIKVGVNKTTLNLPAEIASGTLFTDELYDLNGDNTADPVVAAAGASSMNLPVTYSVTSTSLMSCFVDADKMLHIIGAGVCGVTATSGTATAKNVSTATQTFVVSKRSQVLTVTAPGEVIPDSDPEESAPAATDDPAGFKLAAKLSSSLDPVFTVIPAKNPNGSDRSPNCSVDDSGTVTWIYDMTLQPSSVGYDANGNLCQIAISHPGNTNYNTVVTQYLDVIVTHTNTPSASLAPQADSPVSAGLPRTGGSISKGGVTFDVAVSPTGVTIRPRSRGQFIGPITAAIQVRYKKNGIEQIQSCQTAFGIAALDSNGKIITNPALETKAAIAAVTKPYRAMPMGSPTSGYMKLKYFTNSVTCALIPDAVAHFKAGGQLHATATVVRDRRFPTTYKRVRPNGQKITSNTVVWDIKVG